MGLMCPPFYGKSKFYAKKKAKAEKKIAKLQEVKPELKQHFEMSNFERRVKEMGIEPREYSLEELYVATLMAETDYENTMTKYGINGLDTAIYLAKDWLEDDDSDLRYGEKLGSYYFNVVCID